MAYVPEEKHVKFIASRFKGGAAYGETNYKLQGDAKASHPWWLEDAWSNSYKVDFFYPAINKFFTINLNNANKVQGLLRHTGRNSITSHRDVITSHRDATYQWRMNNEL